MYYVFSTELMYFTDILHKNKKICQLISGESLTDFGASICPPSQVGHSSNSTNSAKSVESSDSIYFVTGIDTDIGKSFVVGLFGLYFSRVGRRVITQKLVQTGSGGGISEDVLVHRRLMGVGVLPEDVEGATCPFVFKYPASPHLAADLENRSIDIQQFTNATKSLLERYNVIIIEGTGGIFVPITNDLSTIDYIKEQNYSVLVVTSGRLGSINHTLLTLEAIQQRNIPLAGIAFNLFPQQNNQIIQKNTLDILHKKLHQLNKPNAIVIIPDLQNRNITDKDNVDFSPVIY
jgi:dethiobiotin synthetase